MEKLNPTEVWMFARVLAGHPLNVKRDSVGASLLAMAQYISTLSWKERSLHLQMSLNPADFERINNADSEQESPPGSLQPGTRQWQIIPASELANLPKATWLIDGVIPEHGLSVLYGAPGAFKSFTALEWALEVTGDKSVIYTIYEGLNGYWQRIKAWESHHKRDHGQLFMCIGNLAVMDTSDLSLFIDDARKFKPALVIVDTLARAMTGNDENSSRDMGLFIAACGRIQQELDCAVLIIHHSNKGGIQERGSIALRGAADVMIKQYMLDDLIVRECAKMKDSEPFETTYHAALSIEIEIDGEKSEVPVLIESSRVIDDDSNLTANQVKVLEVLQLEAFKEGATAVEIGETLPEISRGSLNRIVSRLMKYELVTQSAKRDPYKITEKGMTRMTRMTRMFGAIPEDDEKNAVSLPSQSSQSSQTSHRQMRMIDAPVKIHNNYTEGA